MSALANNSTNSTLPPDSLLGIGSKNTEIALILGLIVIVVGTLVFMSWRQSRKLRQLSEDRWKRR